MKPNSTGIVKYVYDDMTETEITEDIEVNYPSTRYELFKNKEKEFTGMIKVTFENENDLNKAIAEKFTICNKKYIVEPFIFKPKVIKCNTCHMFGHISRWCGHKDKAICGKCTKNHETKDCNIPEQEYKCYMCGENHITGSYSCVKMQEKLQELTESRNGY